MPYPAHERVGGMVFKNVSDIRAVKPGLRDNDAVQFACADHFRQPLNLAIGVAGVPFRLDAH